MPVVIIFEMHSFAVLRYELMEPVASCVPSPGVIAAERGGRSLRNAPEQTPDGGRTR
jgi:hypothetical protein